MVGDEGWGLPKSGVLTSPNYPERYYRDRRCTQTIQVAEGKTIRFAFTSFNTQDELDYVEIKDEDGTDLTGRLSGNRLPFSGLPRTSNSNIMHVLFNSNRDEERSGWRLEWNEQWTQMHSPLLGIFDQIMFFQNINKDFVIWQIETQIPVRCMSGLQLFLKDKAWFSHFLGLQWLV